MNRRKIERYAQLLDKASGGPRHHVPSPIDDELSDLVGLADHLGAAAPDVRPSESFRAETRAFLMATAAREGIGRSAVAPEPGRAVTPIKTRTTAVSQAGRRRIRARGAILVGLAVGTLALSGMSAASGSAMPGDTLYGIKRSQEGAQLALASSDAGRGKLYLEFARTRLGEAEAIKADPSLLKSTLADMDKETRQGVSLLTADAVTHKNPAALSTIDQFVTRQSGDLNQLLDGVSDDERSMVASSASMVGNAGLRSADVRKVLDCDRIPTVGTDEFGPMVGSACAEAVQINTKSPFQPASDAQSGNSGTGAADIASADATADQSAPSPGLLADISHLLGGLLG
jgi:hypothetical protein